MLGANAFKKALGGHVVREFECEQIVTLKGWVLLTAARLIAGAKESRRPRDVVVLEGQPDAATV